MTPKDTVEALNNHLDNPDAVRTAAEQGAQDQNRAKDTVEGMDESFSKQDELDAIKNYVTTNDLYGLSEFARALIEDRERELDLTLTKERARVNEVLEGMKNVPDTEAKGYEILEGGKIQCCPGDDAWTGYETALSDAQKRITEEAT